MKSHLPIREYPLARRNPPRAMSRRSSREWRLIERAYAELGFKAPKVTYEISFQAAPIEKCYDYMQFNKLFIAFLARDRDEAAIAELSKSFAFGEQISLRNHGLGSEKTAVAFNSRPRNTKLDNDVTTYSFADLPRKSGLPQVSMTLTLTSEAFAITPTKRKAGPELLAVNEFWPSTDPAIVALAEKITAGKTNASDKSAAILDWLMPGKNLRYAGDVTGSRYGVKKVLEQKYGHCWDFADCFVTLCRAAGVPSRQVLGWLYGVSGHVWAEVLIEGQGWRQVDPTGGMGCDSRYMPFVANEDGNMPMGYISPLAIRVIR